MDWKCSHSLDLSFPNRQRLEVSKNVKFIAVTARASKLQVSKVGDLWDLNPGLLRESLNIGKLTHSGGLGSNPGQAEVWRFVTLKPLKLQQCTLNFRKAPVFSYLVKECQVCSCIFGLWYASGNTTSFTSYIANCLTWIAHECMWRTGNSKPSFI